MNAHPHAWSTLLSAHDQTPTSARPPSGWLALLRLQARLMWDWRPTRLAIVRRTVLSYIGACLALTIIASVTADIRFSGAPALLLAALALIAIGGPLAILLHGLLVSLPLLVAQLLGVVAQFGVILALSRILPGVAVSNTVAALLAAVLLTVLNSVFAELVAVSDDDAYYSVLVRRLVAREFGHAPSASPGLLLIQVDGLSRPALDNAIRAGRVPTLASLVQRREATLHTWHAILPPTTPASQAGILHGNNDGIAGFRWYEKDTGRLLVANHPVDATEIVRRVSDGRGILSDDGASIGNLVTGDAPRSYLTMATIAKADPTDKRRRLRGFFVTTVDYLRLLVLMVGEVAKDLYQAERQRGWGVAPRMARGIHFAIERAATNVALRTISTALVIEEMYSGTPTIYVDYTGYDAVSHHCGPERMESIDALAGIDRAIGSLRKAARYTWRPYRMVILSDHGQALGATFRQQHGATLEAVIAQFLTDGAVVTGTTGAAESAGIRNRMAAEFGRSSGLERWSSKPSASTQLPGGGSGPETGGAVPDVVAAASGNLAHLYFPDLPGRAAEPAVAARWPRLIDGLRRHAGIGAVVVQSAEGHPVVLGAASRLDLATGHLEGTDPLAAYGPLAADAIRRLSGFSTCGDIVLLGAIDPVTGDVTGLEELIGSHGGLGGWQNEPFILVPTGLALSGAPLVGAPALYQEIRAWQGQLTAG